jgi:hypothetical protein
MYVEFENAGWVAPKNALEFHTFYSDRIAAMCREVSRYGWEDVQQDVCLRLFTNRAGRDGIESILHTFATNGTELTPGRFFNYVKRIVLSAVLNRTRRPDALERGTVFLDGVITQPSSAPIDVDSKLYLNEFLRYLQANEPDLTEFVLSIENRDLSRLMTKADAEKRQRLLQLADRFQGEPSRPTMTWRISKDFVGGRPRKRVEKVVEPKIPQCRKGHIYTPETFTLTKRGSPRCKICAKLRVRERRKLYPELYRGWDKIAKARKKARLLCPQEAKLNVLECGSPLVTHPRRIMKIIFVLDDQSVVVAAPEELQLRQVDEFTAAFGLSNAEGEFHPIITYPVVLTLAPKPEVTIEGEVPEEVLQ